MSPKTVVFQARNLWTVGSLSELKAVRGVTRFEEKGKPPKPQKRNENPKRREVHQGHTKKPLTTLVETFVYWQVMGPCHGHQPQVDKTRPPQPTVVDP